MRKNKDCSFFYFLRVFKLIAHYSLLIAFVVSCSSVHTKTSPAPVYDKTNAVASWYGPKVSRPTDFLRRDIQHVRHDLRT